jgi:hypothetical protein
MKFHDCLAIQAVPFERLMLSAVREGIAGTSIGHTTIYKDDGRRRLCEFDGVAFGKLQGHDVLVLLDAKHTVSEEDLDCDDPKKLGLKQRLEVFGTFYGTLKDKKLPLDASKTLRQQHNAYMPLLGMKVMGAIGGVHFDPTVQDRAKQLGFLVVTTDGRDVGYERYTMQ